MTGQVQGVRFGESVHLSTKYTSCEFRLTTTSEPDTTAYWMVASEQHTFAPVVWQVAGDANRTTGAEVSPQECERGKRKREGVFNA